MAAQTLYQLHMKCKDGSLFALPVFGTDRSIWDALAQHRHYRTFQSFCKVKGIDDPDAFKSKFIMKQV